MALLSPNSLVFARYWARMPKIGLLPHRRNFAPEELSPILSTFVIIELTSSVEARFRLAGTAEAARYGRDVTGLNYLDFVDPSRRAKAFGAFEAMASTPCGMVAVIESKSAAGLDFVNEAIGFPIRHRAGPDGEPGGKESGLPLLYFQSNTITNYAHHDAYRDRLSEHTGVSKRYFIDIGAGVPNFSD